MSLTLAGLPLWSVCTKQTQHFGSIAGPLPRESLQRGAALPPPLTSQEQTHHGNQIPMPPSVNVAMERGRL